MIRNSRWKVALVLAATLFGLLFTAPNFIPADVRAKLPAWLPHSALNLGLDLQGGSRLRLPGRHPGPDQGAAEQRGRGHPPGAARTGDLLQPGRRRERDRRPGRRPEPGAGRLCGPGQAPRRRAAGRRRLHAGVPAEPPAGEHPAHDDPGPGDRGPGVERRRPVDRDHPPPDQPPGHQRAGHHAARAATASSSRRPARAIPSG